MWVQVRLTKEQLELIQTMMDGADDCAAAYGMENILDGLRDEIGDALREVRVVPEDLPHGTCSHCYEVKMEGEECCNHEMPGGPFVCTKPKGHVGSHVACGIWDHFIAGWEQTDERANLEVITEAQTKIAE